MARHGERLGLVHIYTGDGKGKTTAAVGLGLRAAGNGYRVHIIQFLKAQSPESGEIRQIKQLANVTVARYGGNLLGKDHPPVEEIRRDVAEGMREAGRIAEEELVDVLVLDEIVVAASLDLIENSAVLRVVDLCKGNIELVMTGRGAGEELIGAADYVTELRMIKHPYEAGIPARRGIEF